jgi:N-acyl homoserine lactone hydrolase
MILPGHRIARAFVLDFGSFDVGPGKRRIGIPGFLLQTDHGANILVDTGFDPAYAMDYATTDARDRLSDFGRLITFTAAQTAAGQLALLGLTPADITHVILTHGHIDHVGSLPLFTCPIILTQTERSLPRPIYWHTSQPIPWPAAPYVEITDETDVCDDLRLIPTPGHTPGHLSALLTISDKSVILAADAINRASEPAEGFPDAMDPVTAATSAARLFALQREHNAEIIYGHDPEQWSRLPKAPLLLAGA